MKDFIAELMKLKVFPKFGVYESDCEVLSPDAQTFESDVYDLARKYGIRIQTAYGVSQYVIILPDKTVIKIPFLGFYYGDPYAEDETECNDAYFERFDNNYSEIAVEVYQDALLKGIGEMFSKIEKIGFTSNGHPIYKQEYAESLCSKEIDVKEDSLTKAKEMEHNRYLPFSTRWLALVIEKYGEEEIEKLMDFIEEEQIGDFHSGNYGFTATGAPVVFDYSDFNE